MYKMNTNFPILSALCSNRWRRMGYQTRGENEGVYRLPVCVCVNVRLRTLITCKIYIHKTRAMINNRGRQCIT